MLGKFNGGLEGEMLRSFHRSVSSLLTFDRFFLRRPNDSRVLYFWNSSVNLNSSDNKVITFFICVHYNLSLFSLGSRLVGLKEN